MAAPTQHSMTTGILVEYYVLTAIALVLVIARLWMRLAITARNWGWDDYTIVIAWLCSVVGLILIQLAANIGSNPMSTGQSGPAKLRSIRFNTFFEMASIVCTLVTKFSICCYILRIRDDRRMRWALAFLMVPMTLITVAIVIVLSVSCTPLWSDNIPTTCVPVSGMYTAAYVQSALTIVVDLCLTSAPVIILWDVRIQLGRKLFVCGLMSLGLIATLSNALRSYWQYHQSSRGLSFNMTWLTVFCILEQSAGIIAACIPACVPIFRRGRAKEASQNGLLADRQNYYELSNQYSAQGKSLDRTSYTTTTVGEECVVTVDPVIKSGKSSV
ncbi:hypothetical protein P170DRAFT_469595 [Aspergillus steynii IBT 23096]|uniref:Rhodopsin domain-containing protein n=1 Tax=Aspergillus steynii IBT 23096 TaxID=1392250 RepID=A0A2I2GMQ0_9EURO|nr:uncharacterized protein P170DRAFT_469595 [Aspergillus steynii IBT 23096]PLB54130.1 hypothetical protein P170DRAFT_469595 [Aspergillus steynii IBT 23096]